MKKNVLSVALFLASSMAMAQVGIGTLQPDKSALLDIEAAPNNLKGVLIPRVPLVSTTDNSNINNGKTASSLLVFNTTTNESVTPGYYYWFGNQWVRIVSATDPLLNNFAINEELAVDLVKETLFLRDSKNHIVSVPLSEINILTTFESTGSGQYTYTSEDNTKTILSIPDEVISNISIILENEQVVNEIYEVIAAQGKELKGDGIISVTGGNQAVLHATSLGIKDYSITNTKLIATSNDAGKALVVGADGKLNYVLLDDTNTVISRFEIDNTGKFLELEDSATLNFSVPIQDLNILTTLANQQDGSYIYINEMGDSVTINVVVDVIKNIQTILGDTIVATEVYETVAAKGKVLRSTEGSILVTGGGKAVLEATQIDIADGGVKTNKIANQAVTEDKLGAPASVAVGAIPAVQTDRSVKYQSLAQIVEQQAADVTSSDATIRIENGAGQVDGTKSVLKGLNLSLADEAVTTAKIADKNVTAIKLDGGNGADNRVAVSDSLGVVNYVLLTNDLIANPGSITSDNIIEVADGSDAVLKDLSLSIKENSIDADRLKASGVNSGNVLTADGSGKVSYQPITSGTITDSKKLTTDGIITVNNLASNELDKAVLQPIELGVKDQGISTAKIADEAVTTAKIKLQGVTEDKLGAPATSPAASVPAVQADRSVKYQPIGTLLAAEATDLKSSDGTIQILDVNGQAGGVKAVLQNVNLSLADGSVSTPKLIDHAVTEEKLWAGLQKENYIPVAQSSGAVIYQSLESIQEGKALTIDNSLKITGVATEALLNPIGLEVNTAGIITKHIEDKAVVAAKIGSENAAIGTVLSSMGNGSTSFVPSRNLVEEVMKGDIQGDQVSIQVASGVNTVFGNNGEDVTISLIASGVKERHLATESVTKDKVATNAISTVKIENKAVTAVKLDGGNGAANRVAVSDATGVVTYKPFTTDLISNSGNITTDGIVAVTDGTGATLKDITLSIADNSVEATKLAATGAASGMVLTADGTGAVSYEPLLSEQISNSAALTSDGIVTLNGSTSAVGKSVLKDVVLGIKDLGIATSKLADTAVTTSKLAEQAVTIVKLGSEDEVKDQILLTDGQGGFIYSTIDAVQADGQDLTTDGIIGFASGDGENAVLVPTKLQINDGSIPNEKIKNNTITKGKLNSETQPLNMLLVTDGHGGFDYVVKEAVQAGGEDLDVGTALEFTAGDGKNIVLAPTTIDVKDLGITEAKLATDAVSTVKIKNLAVSVDKMNSIVEGNPMSSSNVLVADGQGGVGFEDMEQLVFDQGKDLTSDGSLSIPTNNKSLLKGTSIKVAPLGIKNEHIAAHAVTTTNISSKEGTANAAEHTVLTADGQGNATFVSVDRLVFDQGADVNSPEGTILVTDGVKAALSPMQLDIATSGVQNKHIANLAVTSSKINSEGSSEHYVLSADGEGGAAFMSITDVATSTAHDLQGSSSIEVTNGVKAIFRDAVVHVKDLGITNEKIATQTIKAIKMDSETNAEGTVLTALGDGEAKYLSLDTYGKALTPDASIVVTNGEKALLDAASIRVNNSGILNNHIGAQQVTANKISSVVNASNVTDDHVLAADGQGGAVYKNVGSFLENHGKEMTSDGSIAVVSGNKSLIKETEIKIADAGVKANHIDVKQVDETKFSTTGKAKGTVLVADGVGGASYEAIKAMMPKFFYMPSIALDVKPNLSGNRNIYQEYVTQFGTPMVANPGAQSGGNSASLPVLPATELNFFITYYDTAIFENVTLSNDGILTYKVKVDAVISGQSFMNIVLAVKE